MNTYKVHIVCNKYVTNSAINTIEQGYRIS
nr:MAG TPA: hypothetical protein [Caudoviricetes sp.]